MGKQSHDRNRLLVLYECGIKWAKKLINWLIPLSTIYDHLKRFQTGKGKARKVGWGRPPKLNANDRRRVTQLANFHEKWSATRIASNWTNKYFNSLLRRRESTLNTKNVYKTLLKTQLTAQTCYNLIWTTFDKKYK